MAGENVTEVVEACFPDNRPACYKDLIYYSDKKANPTAYHMNGTFDPKDLTLKSEKDLPAEFLPKDSKGNVIPGRVEIPENILKVAKNKGWDNLLYKTRSTGGFDNAPNLFMLGISTDETDIFLQTSPHPDSPVFKKLLNRNNQPDPKPSNDDFTQAQDTLTVITVDKTKTPPVGQLRLMTKINGTNSYRWNNNTQISSCISCHTQPLRPISPRGYEYVNGKEKKMSPEQAAQVAALNQKLSQPTSWGSRVINGKEVRFGPAIDSQPLGWAPEDSFTRKEEFLRSCATRNPAYSYSGYGDYRVQLKQNNPPEINYEKLSEAMNCFKCHDGNTRGPIHEYMSEGNFTFKVAVDRSMPHGIDLNTDERLALVNCLPAERVALKNVWRKGGSWMSQVSCYGDQFNGKPPKIIGSPTKTTTIENKASEQ